MSLRRTGSVAAGLLLTGAMLAAGGPSAWADGSPGTTPTTAPTVAPSAPGPAGTPGGDDVRLGAKRLCRRVPVMQRHIAAALTRLNGAAGVKGSIATLQQRAADAQAKGDTAVYTYLEDRLTFRKSLVPMLQQRSSDLTQVATWCSQNGLGSDSAPGSTPTPGQGS